MRDKVHVVDPLGSEYLGFDLSDFQTLLQVGLQAKGEVFSKEELENLSSLERAALINQVIEHLHISSSVTNVSGLQDRFYAKFGKIIIDAINRDISIFHAVKAMARFLKHDFRTTRILSRIRRKSGHLDVTDPIKFAGAFRAGGVSPVFPVINQIKTIRKRDPIEASAFAQAVLSDSMTKDQRKLLVFALYDGGNVTDANTLGEKLKSGDVNSSEALRLRRIRSEYEVLSGDLNQISENILHELQGHEASQSSYVSSDSEMSMAYVAASTLPFNSAGYAIRTHHLVRAMTAAGLETNMSVFPVARPAFPWDRFDLDRSALSDDAFSDVDDVRYHYLKSDIHMQDDLISYARKSAEETISFCRSKGVKIICAASNHVNAWQAFLAARHLGIPFTYEVRGLWEESRTARTPGWENTERFAVERKVETFLIEQADHVFFITRQVRDLFVPPNSDRLSATSLAPNCAVIPNVAETATYVKSQQTGPLDLLYLGSILEYEGLQLLLKALSQIENSERFRLTIVGGGRYEATLKNISLSKGLEDRVMFTGRVSPDQVADYYQSSDLVVVPRLPNRVSQLVSPLKPLEAMMYSRVCLASNVGPIADLIEDGKTGYLFEAGDVDSLVAKLNEIYVNRAGLDDMSKTAMKMVRQDRNWTHLGAEMVEILTRLAEPS